MLLRAAKKTPQKHDNLCETKDVTLTDKSMRYTTSQIKRGRGTKVAAEELNISQRHVQRLWVEAKARHDFRTIH